MFASSEVTFQSEMPPVNVRGESCGGRSIIYGIYLLMIIVSTSNHLLKDFSVSAGTFGSQ